MQTVDLTPEQEAELVAIYQYTDKADITDSEIALAREMFNSPEKLVLLRKMLGIITMEERGIGYEGPNSSIAADDFEKLGIETAIQKNVEARIKRGILTMYNLIKGTLKQEAKAEMEAKNVEKLDSEEYQEGKAEVDAATNRPGGVNL